MRHRFSLICVVALAATALAGAGCKKKDAGIHIGEYASLTGTTATFGTASHQGTQLALDEANAAGGIDGKPITLITEDDQSKPDVARNVVNKLVTQDGVLAVLGEVASTRSMAAAPVCQQYKTPMISPCSTNPEVTKKGDYIFRVCFTDDFQAAVQAKFAWDQGWKKMAVFKDLKNDYSMGLAKFFTDEYTKRGGKILGENTYQEGDADFKAQLNTLKELKPDAIFIPGYYSEVGTIARQAREIGITCPFLGGDGWDSPKLVPGAGTALEGCYFSDHFFYAEKADPNAQKFIEAYRKKYNDTPDVLAALGYDSTNLLIDAIKRAKTKDGPGLRDAIAQTTGFKGVTGDITIDKNRNARKPAVILKIEGNNFKYFKTYTPETIGQ